MSGAVYLINDVSDREQDQQHPLKRMRPIAAGYLSPGAALALAGVLGAIALTASFLLRPAFGVTAAAYLALFVVYTRWLKHIVILDVMAIALGFVLRAVAGGLVIHVHVSNWLLVCTMLGALFLGLRAASRETLLVKARRTSPYFGGVRPVLARPDVWCGGRGDDGRLHHLLCEP